MHWQEEEEKRGDIHPVFSLILGIKVIQSKWLKGTGLSSSSMEKEKKGKTPPKPTLVTNNLIIIWNTSIISLYLINAGMFINTKEYEGHIQKEQDKYSCQNTSGWYISIKKW